VLTVRNTAKLQPETAGEQSRPAPPAAQSPARTRSPVHRPPTTPIVSGKEGPSLAHAGSIAELRLVANQKIDVIVPAADRGEQVDEARGPPDEDKADRHVAMTTCCRGGSGSNARRCLAREHPVPCVFDVLARSADGSRTCWHVYRAVHDVKPSRPGGMIVRTLGLLRIRDPCGIITWCATNRCGKSTLCAPRVDATTVAVEVRRHARVARWVRAHLDPERRPDRSWFHRVGPSWSVAAAPRAPRGDGAHPSWIRRLRYRRDRRFGGPPRHGRVNPDHAHHHAVRRCLRHRPPRPSLSAPSRPAASALGRRWRSSPLLSAASSPSPISSKAAVHRARPDVLSSPDSPGRRSPRATPPPLRHLRCLCPVGRAGPIQANEDRRWRA